MKVFTAAVLSAIAGVVSGCAHDHSNGRDFTPEELAELERKWGMEVIIPPPAPKPSLSPN
jgi:hypothetical protein